jgi:TMEM175 potassium channel family protein
MDQKSTPERLSFFSDGVFAIIMTILVLELRAPESASFSALLPLWPAVLSYALSYLFLAIVWVNHHHLLRYAEVATPRLIWANFAHLFSMSLLPFSTAWMARTQLAPAPVALYAGVFVLVNATYLLLCRELVDKSERDSVATRRMMRLRSVATLVVFAIASLVSLKFPYWGLGLACCCLALYVRPQAPVVHLRPGQ